MAKNQAQFDALIERIRTNTLQPKDTDKNGVLQITQ